MGIEIGQILAIGGPTSVITAIFVVLINAYLSARKDKREQQAADVATDSGIVDNAKKVLELVRNETDRMELRIIDLEKDKKAAEDKNKELEQHINKQDDLLARQTRQLEWLEEDLKKARLEIQELRNRNGSGSPTPA